MRELLQSRFLRGVLVGVALTVVVLVGAAAWTWSRASSPECAELKREDLSIDEMVAIKRRVDDYRRDPSAPLELSGREASFLVREHLRVPAWLGVVGEEVAMDMRIAQRDRCWNIAFRGSVEVLDGIAHVVPTSLKVGRLDLTWWTRGTPYEIESDQVGEEAAADLLQHVTSLHVASGRIALRVDDPDVLK